MTTCRLCGHENQGTPVRTSHRGARPKPVDGWQNLCHNCQLKAKVHPSNTEGMLADTLEIRAGWFDKAPSIDATNLDPTAVAAMTDDQALDEVIKRRWPNGIRCPKCGHSTYYRFKRRERTTFKCTLCKHQYTATSGTVWSSNKVGMKGLLLLMSGEPARDVVNQKSFVSSERRRILSTRARRCRHGQLPAYCVDCDRDKIAALYQQGLSGIAIAKLMGKGQSTIYDALRSRGISRRRRWLKGEEDAYRI